MVGIVFTHLPSLRTSRLTYSLRTKHKTMCLTIHPVFIGDTKEVSHLVDENEFVFLRQSFSEANFPPALNCWHHWMIRCFRTLWFPRCTVVLYGVNGAMANYNRILEGNYFPGGAKMLTYPCSLNLVTFDTTNIVIILFQHLYVTK